MADVSSTRHQMNIWGDADCSLVRFDLAAGAELELDQMIHDDVVILAFEGCGWISREGRGERQEQPGDIILRGAGESFSIRTDWIARTGGICREIHMSRARLAQLTDEEDAPLAGLDFGCGLLSDPALAGELMALHTRFEHAHEALEASEAVAGWLEQLASRLSPVQRLECSSVCQRGIARLVEYLRAHASETLSLDDLAQVAQMNRFVLLRQFRARIGVTPHEYQRIRRIVMAKQHLRNGMPLAELSTACGFFDQSHMTREFKRRTGLTPTAFIPQRPQAMARQ